MSRSTHFTDAWIEERLRRLGMQPIPGPPVVWHDTSNYMSIERGHFIELAGDFFLVRCNEREGRFGMEDQPKFWVKRALDLDTGQMHILKLVFQEGFNIRIGNLQVKCVRSGEKEGRVLELVRGDGRFMQGRTALDSRGNLVRVIDFISGVDLLSYLHSIPLRHEEYAATLLPEILVRVRESCGGIQRLHDAGLCHGDIRNDHLLIERDTDCYKWIDFDLNQDFSDFDVWSVGNILHCVVAKGFVSFSDALQVRPELSGQLKEDDASVFFPHRVMNLRRVYPYLPAKLNQVLLRFSFGAPVCYDQVWQILDDLSDCAESMSWKWNGI